MEQLGRIVHIEVFNMTEPIDIDAEDFVGIEYNNDDCDTDRGTMHNRWVGILFKSHQIAIGEEDFKLLIDAMRKYVHSEDAEIALDKEQFEWWMEEHPKEAKKIYPKEYALMKKKTIKKNGSRRNQ